MRRRWGDGSRLSHLSRTRRGGLVLLGLDCNPAQPLAAGIAWAAQRPVPRTFVAGATLLGRMQVHGDAIVAQANKTARIAWAILTTEQRYRAS